MFHGRKSGHARDDDGNDGDRGGPAKPAVPWLSMLTSVPCLAVGVTHFCSAWGWYLMAVNIPLFASEALGLDVVSNGFLSGLPYLGMMLLSVTGKLFDVLLDSGRFRLISLRKLFNTVGFLFPAACNFCLPLLPRSSPMAPMLLLSLGMSFHELAQTGGFYFSHADVAGAFSGVLFGLTNTVAQIPGFATPMTVAALTPNVSIFSAQRNS